MPPRWTDSRSCAIAGGRVGFAPDSGSRVPSSMERRRPVRPQRRMKSESRSTHLDASTSILATKPNRSWRKRRLSRLSVTLRGPSFANLPRTPNKSGKRHNRRSGPLLVVVREVFYNFLLLLHSLIPILHIHLLLCVFPIGGTHLQWQSGKRRSSDPETRSDLRKHLCHECFAEVVATWQSGSRAGPHAHKRAKRAPSHALAHPRQWRPYAALALLALP